MGLEDIALMRALPTLGVFQPMDARETELIMDYLVTQWKGPAYLRLTRQNLPDLYPKDFSFQPGRLLRLDQPSQPAPQEKIDVALIATGASVAEAVAAAEKLKQDGVKALVWNAHTLKPFDQDTVLKIAPQARLIVTVEDHSVIGGLGTCVAEALATVPQHPRLIKLGIQDLFGESGEAAELYEKFGISAHAIENRIRAELKHR